MKFEQFLVYDRCNSLSWKIKPYYYSDWLPRYFGGSFCFALIGGVDHLSDLWLEPSSHSERISRADQSPHMSAAVHDDGAEVDQITGGRGLLTSPSQKGHLFCFCS